MNALVISGGGSKGAFAGGVAEHLIRDRNKTYDLFVGTSTGSLLAPLLAAGELDMAKKVYANVRQKDIFSISPFIFRKKENGSYDMRINHWGIIKMFWRGEKTFGDTHKLRKLIGRTFTRHCYDRVRSSGKEVVVSVANLTLQQEEYKSSNDWGYKDFCDWIWASTCMVPFMSLVHKKGCDYGDGGFGNVVPIREAVRRGASVVDVIVLYPPVMETKSPPITNAFSAWNRTYDYMFNQIIKDDLAIGNLVARRNGTALNLYHTPRLLTEQSFIFDPPQMVAWWEEGRQYFETREPERLLIGGKTKKPT